MRRVLGLVLLLIAAPAALQAQDVRLPLKDGSVRFAVIGDTGTGDNHQREIADQLLAWRAKFPFAFVVMMGDNLYSGDSPSDYQKEFEVPYKALLDGGVKFYASLGNHDNPNERLYKPFNMNGERYYTFKPEKASARFFALDSNYIDKKQLDWLDKQLLDSGSDWKICFFHHPPYSSGDTHGSAVLQREQLEPLFVKHGVNLVLTGHEHFYERIKPQKGIAYFIVGNSAKLRRGNITKTDLTDKGFDQGYTFMLMEIVGNELYFQTVSDKGQTIDSGTIHRVGKTAPNPERSTQPVATPPAPKQAPKQPVETKPAAPRPAPKP
jgi:3',5'-cyclic AMP phosphodiesterase CpdA